VRPYALFENGFREDLCQSSEAMLQFIARRLPLIRAPTLSKDCSLAHSDSPAHWDEHPQVDSVTKLRQGVVQMWGLCRYLFVAHFYR